MNTPSKKYMALTYRFNGKTNVLITPIHISFPYDPIRDVGKIPPNAIECQAIWDTGATNSVITKGLALKMGLIPSGKEKVTNTSSIELKNSYVVNVILPSKVIFSYLKTTECENVLGNGQAEMLIGMDIISSGDFAISYENNKTVMSFIMPPIKTIDYVPISESENQKQERLDLFNTQQQLRSKHQLSKKALKAIRKKKRQNRKKNRKKH